MTTTAEAYHAARSRIGWIEREDTSRVASGGRIARPASTT